MNTIDLFKNYSLSTESFDMPDYEYNMRGGNISDNNIPTGGFPPIFICKQEDINQSDDKQNDSQTKREYKTHKSAISIKDLLEKRRKTTPFISK
ncbi:hypothetical protein QKU48_gp0360 [Fadolivirus algeromassiliense]|jgi:hypothetical protein|uniref:Uncharacterized protein n=1 Tax=Fadolivirus FV1/VV64 TaxID=3070911 RepID=A0A7D3R1I6_9VIRU|nr:hypothetical protein QKU48_gp0360 [Fadolivirus algeromassiliense]QKF93818.1 hypothetical protein Fadolivirus_1_360 [Fadolivirus FV1/VV64]